MAVKQCNKCGDEKPLDQFGQTRDRGKVRVRKSCRSCLAEQTRLGRSLGIYNTDKLKDRERARRNKAIQRARNVARTGRSSGDWWDRLPQQVYRAAADGREYWGATLEQMARDRRMAMQKDRRTTRTRQPWHASGMSPRERNRLRWTLDPKYRLYHRLKRWMQKHLRDGKESKVWTPRLGYSVDELHRHLERQFTKGMGWHNMGRWHIDHIVPVHEFEFDSPDHPDFAACYALTNLRPVWARENLRKNAKRLHLL